MSDAREPVEVEFDLWGRKLRGKHWPAAGLPWIGLHGWLDNANSFDDLARLCPELNLYALDLAGHGLSDHRGLDVSYQGVLYSQDILKVAADQGWDRFNLLAHSMGTEISIWLMGPFPEKVETLVCVEGFAQANSVEVSLSRDREMLDLMATRTLGPQRYFPDFDTMVDYVARLGEMRPEVTRALLERGAVETEDGFTWRSDPRVRWGNSLKMSAERIAYTLEKFNKPILAIRATRGSVWFRETMDESVSQFDLVKLKRLDGDHHIHMGETAKTVAAEIRAFLSD